MSTIDTGAGGGRLLDLSPIVTPAPWDRVAGAYSSFVADHLARYAEDAIRLAGLRAGQRALDVATGPGTLALQAARVASVDALDFSQGMLDELQLRATADELARLTLHRGDGQALPFPADHFDAVFSMFGLFLFPDRSRGFAEMARVLRSGGRAVVASWQPQDEIPAFSVVLDELRRRMPILDDAPPAPLSDRRSVESEMSAAGFEVEVHAITHTLEAPSLDELWQGLRRSHVALAIAEEQLDSDGFARLADSIRRRLEQELDSGPQQVVMPAWLGVGRLP